MLPHTSKLVQACHLDLYRSEGDGLLRLIIAAASTRSSPEKEAAPDDATATVGFLIGDNVPAHTSDDRRSSDELADPFPLPPASGLKNPGVDRNSLPEGEIDAIVTVIELDIISIVITIISIIITAVSTAAPRHRCNNLGWILIV
ncbi:hypothetical protein QYE76_012302 [Lolium multiflorum]|uniref:Uncharacterized protein n=1 Tax=Lolium multiflorum TaxID=4521 RepID=A0AAD8TWZ1_LOLMU|nr:hypothetical protein QYE76_012302 [Lolium multiflorum]